MLLFVDFCVLVRQQTELVPNREVHIPSGDGVEQRLWHANELRVTNGVDSIPPRRARDDIKLPDSISLTVLSYDGDAAVLLLSDSAKTTIDDNVEAVAFVFGSPEDLASVDLYPVERSVDMEDCTHDMSICVNTPDTMGSTKR